MRILEQTRLLLMVRFGDALLPVFASIGAFVLGLGALVAASVIGNVFVGAVGALLVVAGGLMLMGERHVTLTIDRNARTIHIRSWKNLIPREVLFRLEEIKSFDLICGQARSGLSSLIPIRRTRCMIIANFPTGPDVILVRGLSESEAKEAHRLIATYIE